MTLTSTVLTPTPSSPYTVSTVHAVAAVGFQSSLPLQAVVPFNGNNSTVMKRTHGGESEVSIINNGGCGMGQTDSTALKMAKIRQQSVHMCVCARVCVHVYVCVHIPVPVCARVCVICVNMRKSPAGRILYYSHIVLLLKQKCSDNNTR